MTKPQSVRSGFTIVELLVVIVVIGILAAITVVSYVGVTDKAIATSLKSDLSNASDQLKLYQIEHDVYPSALSPSPNYCPTQPTASNNYCLKVSPGNVFYYYPASDGESFILTVAHGTIKYSITNTGSPEVVTTVAVGNTYRGGIVAYILKNGDFGYDSNVQHGMIIATVNQSTGAQWGCNGVTIGATLGYGYSVPIDLTLGKQNTAKIIAGCTEANTAAKLASNVNSGGYSDWYLPSAQQLVIIRNAYLGSSCFWSSTEYNANKAYEIDDFDDAGIGKVSLCSVRAFRNF